MTKKNLFLIASLLVFSIFAISTASSFLYYDDLIIASDSSCNTQTTFTEGEEVYIKVGKLSTGLHTWTVKSTCDEEIVASGSFFADYSPYSQCFNATIADSTCSEYEIKVTDAIHKNPKAKFIVNSIPIVPEFGLLIGSMTIISAILVFLIIRKN